MKYYNKNKDNPNLEIDLYNVERILPEVNKHLDENYERIIEIYEELNKLLPKKTTVTFQF